MNDEDLDLVVASTSRIDDASVARLALSGPEDALLEAIMSTPRDDETHPAPHPPDHRPRRQGRSRRRRLVTPVAVAAVLVVGLVGVQQLERDGGGRAWASEVVAVAEAAPRLLVDDPDWEVTRADEFGKKQGEMTFSDGREELEVRWRPARDFPGLVHDRAMSSDLRASAPVVGRQATVFRYAKAPDDPAGAPPDFAALWVQGDHVVEARGASPHLAGFRGRLRTLVEVSVDDWLSALPASVVRPGSRAKVVNEMLADMPLPDGLDRAALQKGDAVRDRYQVGADVAGTVACLWMDRWFAATDAGDSAEVERATDALASSHDWKVLREMEAEGAYPETLWDMVDTIVDPDGEHDFTLAEIRAQHRQKLPNGAEHMCPPLS